MMKAFRIITYHFYYSCPPCVLEGGVKLQMRTFCRWVTIATFKCEPDDAHRTKAIDIMNELQKRQEE